MFKLEPTSVPWNWTSSSGIHLSLWAAINAMILKVMFILNANPVFGSFSMMAQPTVRASLLWDALAHQNTVTDTARQFLNLGNPFDLWWSWTILCRYGRRVISMDFIIISDCLSAPWGTDRPSNQNDSSTWLLKLRYILSILIVFHSTKTAGELFSKIGEKFRQN